MRTKTSSIATMIAALGIGLLTATPALSTKNNGGFQQSAEAQRLKFCDSLQSSYNEVMDYYNANPKQRSSFKKTADNLKILGEGNNCGWAM